jgi:hypothetical protein
MTDKGLKTFNLRRSTIRIVRQKQNQSEFVDKAIMKLHNSQEEFNIADVPTRQLMAVLQQREDTPRHIKVILWDQLVAETTS